MIEIKHELSETYREIYVFDVLPTFVIYRGIYYSHRNDRFDIWGDEWADVYGKDEGDAKQKCISKYQQCFFDEIPRSCQLEWEAIGNKYNPVLNKTKDGKSYYSGQMGGLTLPTPKLSVEELRQKIKEKMMKRIDEATIMLHS